VVAPSALACFDDYFEAWVAHIRLPVTHRRVPRTTNLLEWLFVEERRLLKIVPDGFGEKLALKLRFGEPIRAAERWRGLRGHPNDDDERGRPRAQAADQQGGYAR
jgi:putative transposase